MMNHTNGSMMPTLLFDVIVSIIIFLSVFVFTTGYRYDSFCQNLGYDGAYQRPFEDRYYCYTDGPQNIKENGLESEFQTSARIFQGYVPKGFFGPDKKQFEANLKILNEQQNQNDKLR